MTQSAREPFVLQGQDDALGDRDRAVSAHRTEAVLDIPPMEEVSEHLGDRDFFLAADEVPGSPVLGEGLLHRLPCRDELDPDVQQPHRTRAQAPLYDYNSLS